MIAGVEQVVFLYVQLVFWLLPSKAGVNQRVRFVFLSVAIKVGILSHAVLPAEVHSQRKVLYNGHHRVGNQLVAQILQRILRNYVWLALLVLINVAVACLQCGKAKSGCGRNLSSNAVNLCVVNALPYGIVAQRCIHNPVNHVSSAVNPTCGAECNYAVSVSYTSLNGCHLLGFQVRIGLISLQFVIHLCKRWHAQRCVYCGVQRPVLCGAIANVNTRINRNVHVAPGVFYGHQSC